MVDTPRIRMTTAEYIAMPDDGKRYELHDGILVEERYTLPNGDVMASPTVIHGLIVSLFVMALRQYVHSRQLGHVIGDNLDYILDEALILRPDVSFVAASRAPVIPDYFHFAPDIAVEVISPSNSASEMMYKITAYLQYGARLVWIVDPVHKTVTVYQPMEEGDSLTRVLRVGDILTGGDVLPEFRLPVQEIFNGLD